MADQADVENALTAAVAAVLYPSGALGSAPPSVLGCPARIGRGWPSPPALDADLRAQVLNITVYPRPGMERNTTRYLSRWVAQSPSLATFTLSASGQAITVAGAQPATFYAHNLAVLIEGQAYVYTTVSTDTASTIAAGLAALIEAAWPGVTVSGATLTLPSTAIIGALRVGTSGQALREITRQERQFQIVVWAFDPAIRDQACALVKPELDAIEFLSMPDGSAARLIYAGSASDDAPQKELLYRRDLFYLAEWATCQTAEAVQIVAFGTELETSAGDELAETFV